MKRVERQLGLEDDFDDIVQQAVEELAQGGCIGLPTPQGYVGLLKGVWACDEPEPPVFRLLRLQDEQQADHAQASDSPEPIENIAEAETELRVDVAESALQAVLVLRSAIELHDFFWTVPAKAERLLGRHLPGGLIVEMPSRYFRFGQIEESDPEATVVESRQWAREFVQGVCLPEPLWRPQGTVACQLMAGAVGAAIQALCPWPLVIVRPTDRAERAEKTGVRTVSELSELIPQSLSYTINSGWLEDAQPTALIQIRDRGVRVIQPGPLTDAAIMERSGPSILFVCTGNTCRSPMAEAICRKLLADRLECAPNELSARGIEIASAGIAADYGHPASPEAVVLLAEDGIELSHHESQPISVSLLERSDFVLTMTAHHRLVILNHRPDLADRVHVLGSDQRDIPDPIGGGMDVYRQCREAIERGLQPIIERIVQEL